MVWVRVSVDVNDRGDVLGWSFEGHGPEGPFELVTTSCGPFDDPAECFAAALDDARARFGEQMVLNLF